MPGLSSSVHGRTRTAASTECTASAERSSKRSCECQNSFRRTPGRHTRCLCTWPGILCRTQAGSRAHQASPSTRVTATHCHSLVCTVAVPVGVVSGAKATTPTCAACGETEAALATMDSVHRRQDWLAAGQRRHPPNGGGGADRRRVCHRRTRSAYRCGRVGPVSIEPWRRDRWKMLINTK